MNKVSYENIDELKDEMKELNSSLRCIVHLIDRIASILTISFVLIIIYFLIKFFFF
jgi:hypothetical protein